MSLIPTFSARGAPSCLQPLYFASAVFVNGAREDIGKLLSEFNTVAYFSFQSFRAFKELWIRQGWHFAHMFITEAPTRDMYIKTMLRLLAGRYSYQSSPPYYAEAQLENLKLTGAIARGTGNLFSAILSPISSEQVDLQLISS